MKNNNIDVKLREIADSIAGYWKKHESETGPGLYTGTVGILLFLTYYNRYSGDDRYRKLTDEILWNCCEHISGGIYYTPFSGGLAGMLYGLNHLNKYGYIDIDLDDVHNGYAGFMASSIKIYSISHAFDFMHEATGVAMYLLEYGDSSDLSIVSDYVKILDATAEHKNGTAKWLSDVNAEKKMIYNIALSHGMASIAIFLARCIEKDMGRGISERLLVEVVDYILAQEMDPVKFGSYFPYTSLESDEPIQSRLAWCYGDLGIAIALWRAGEALASTRYKEKALEVMEFAVGRRDLEKEMVLDAGICHGTAGVAQFFRRMFYNSGEDKFLSANKFWIDETIKMSKWKTEDAAGFKTWEKNADNGASDYYFLKGIAGIGLALIASQGGKEFSNWDEILLLS